MRADRNGERHNAAKVLDQLARHPQFRWSTTPEEICGRRRHHRDIRCERAHFVRHIAEAEREHVRIDQQRGVPSLAQLLLGNAKFERQVRRAASEIDAAVVAPERIDQRDPHQRPPTACSVCEPKRDSSQFESELSPSGNATCGSHPVAARKARVSDTYQGWSPGRRGAWLVTGRSPRSCAIISSSSLRLIVFSGPPPRLKTRPFTSSMLSSTESHAATASSTCSASRICKPSP